MRYEVGLALKGRHNSARCETSGNLADANRCETSGKMADANKKNEKLYFCSVKIKDR